GYPVGGEMRHRLATMESLADLDAKLAELDSDSPYPGAAVEGPRGRAGTPKKAHVPEGWMTCSEPSTAHSARRHEAELDSSGGWIDVPDLHAPYLGGRRASPAGVPRPRSRALGAQTAEVAGPHALPAGPRPRAALLGAAQARRQDAGARRRRERLRAHPPHPFPRGRPGGP